MLRAARASPENRSIGGERRWRVRNGEVGAETLLGKHR
jgi:hypothetical protein